MNAEQLHAVALAVRADLSETNAVGHLASLQEALQNVVNDPQQPQHQQQVSDSLSQLTQFLENAPSNQFTPARQQILEAIGAQDLLGEPPLMTVQEILGRNQITPSLALNAVEDLRQRVTNLSAAIESLNDSMEQLKIGTEELEPGTSELGMLVPRSSVSNQLHEYARELSVFDRTFGVFSELATGTRPGFEIRTLSSPDLTVYIELAPKVGAFIAIAIERIVALYRDVLDIRLRRNQLADLQVPKEALEGLDAHATSRMEEGLLSLAGELMESNAGNHDKARSNELKTELLQTLNRIANRIDKGYNFEIRAEPNADGDQEDGEAVANITRIQEAARNMQFFSVQGEPILSLPEPNDEEQEEEN